MNFGEVLQRAWKILWKYKVLWLFGLLASCSGQSRRLSFNYNFSSSDIQSGKLPAGLEPYLQRFEAWGNQMLQWAVPIAAILILLVLLVWAVGTLGSAGLIRGAALADQDAADLSAGHLFSEGYRSFWRLILLDVCLLAVGLGIAFVLIGPMVLLGMAAGPAAGLVMICLVPLACLTIPMGWLLSIYLIQVRQVIVNENLGVFPSLSRAWDLVRGHPAELVLMSLVLIIIPFILNIIIALPFAGVAAAFIFGTLLHVPGIEAVPAFSAIVAFAVLYGLFALFVNALINTFTTTAWTLTYRRLSGQPGQAPTLPVPVAPEA